MQHDIRVECREAGGAPPEVQLAVAAERQQRCRQGVVADRAGPGQRGRHREDGQEAVAQKFQDLAAVMRDALAQGVEMLVEPADDP